MNLAGLVNSFATGTYTVTRSTSTIVRGKRQIDTQSTFTIRASVSPETGLDLERKAEGHTDFVSRQLFTTTELTAGGQGADYEADKVTIDGVEWEVSKVATWKDPVSGGTAYRCVVIRE